MVNLQELKIVALDFSMFPVGLEECLGHFSPTLRSVSLDYPCGTRRQLLGFFRLFPMLNNIEISRYSAALPEYEAPDSQLVLTGGGPRGQLILWYTFDDEELLRDMEVTFGGLRFTSMDLRDNLRGIGFLLKACAHTLETLRLRLQNDAPDRCECVFEPWGIFLTLGLISKFPLKTSTCRQTPSFGL